MPCCEFGDLSPTMQDARFHRVEARGTGCSSMGMGTWQDGQGVQCHELFLVEAHRRGHLDPGQTSIVYVPGSGPKTTL